MCRAVLCCAVLCPSCSHRCECLVLAKGAAGQLAPVASHVAVADVSSADRQEKEEGVRKTRNWRVAGRVPQQTCEHMAGPGSSPVKPARGCLATLPPGCWAFCGPSACASAARLLSVIHTLTDSS